MGIGCKVVDADGGDQRSEISTGLQCSSQCPPQCPSQCPSRCYVSAEHLCLEGKLFFVVIGLVSLVATGYTLDIGSAIEMFLGGALGAALAVSVFNFVWAWVAEVILTTCTQLSQILFFRRREIGIISSKACKDI